MADISITQASVLPTANTQIGRGTVGGSTTITQGQSVYIDPTTFVVKLAKSDSGSTSVPVANLAGVALDQAAPGQPITYATQGDVTYNAVLTAGQIYVVSAANAGGVAPYSDLVSTNYVGVLGVATSTTNLHLDISPTTAQK